MRIAVFLLGALPFWAIAQDPVIPPVIPTAISDSFVEPVINTPIEAPPQPSNDPGPTTDGVPDAPQTTSELPVDLRTTSELPLDIDTTASVPLSQETYPPVVETSTGLVSTSTLNFVLDTTSQLVDETLKPKARKSETTSQIGLEENKTTDALLAKTNAAEEPAGQPPIIVPPPDNNDENSTNEVSRSVEQPVTTERQPGTLEPTSEAITPGTEPAAAVTAPPVTDTATTTAPQDSTAIASSISSQVNNLTPKIDQWKQDPEALKDETNKDVQNTHDDVIAAIVLLGGSPAIPCVPGPMGIINQLACAASGLTAASSAIIAGNVPAVSSAMSDVENNFENSTDDDNQDSEEGKDENEDKTKEASTKLQETIEEPSSQPATTVREATSLEDLTSTTLASTETSIYQPCAMGTCDQVDSCSKPSKQNPEDFRPKCPTNRPESTLPDKRQLEPRYPDNSDSDYFLDLRPDWLSFKYASVTGNYFEFPNFGDASFGIKGLYGCTAVFIVSSQGVYLAHIYEDPVFVQNREETDFDYFREKAIDGLIDGNDHITSVKALMGTDDDPGVLHQSYDPFIIVVPPVTPENRWGQRLPTWYQYEDRVREVGIQLADLIYDDEDRYEVLGYTRTMESVAERDGSIWGRAVLEVDTVNMRWRIWIDGGSQKEENYGFNLDKRQDTPINNRCPVTSQQPPTTLSTSVIPPPPAPTEAPAPAAPQPADPVQTDGNNKGSSMCHSIDDACNRAINSFRDDITYTQFASYYAFIHASLFSIGSCVVEFDCGDWSVGAMNGKQIKDAYHHLMETSDVSRCGTAYLSNSCRVTANYCYDCHEKHQDIPDSGSHGWGFR